jgi:hypothetical protein
MIQSQPLISEIKKNENQSLSKRFFTKYSSIKKPQKIACRIDEYRFLLCRNDRIPQCAALIGE